MMPVMLSGSKRFRSVSSMRRINCPPILRAKSQLNTTVRTLPIWGSPVGLGAKRTRTVILFSRLRRRSSGGARPLLDLRPSVAQRDGSIQDRTFRCSIRIDAEVPKPLELVATARRHVRKARLEPARDQCRQ